jgi:hypothetical protein
MPRENFVYFAVLLESRSRVSFHKNYKNTLARTSFFRIPDRIWSLMSEMQLPDRKGSKSKPAQYIIDRTTLHVWYNRSLLSHY